MLARSRDIRHEDEHLDHLIGPAAGMAQAGIDRLQGDLELADGVGRYRSIRLHPDHAREVDEVSGPDDMAVVADGLQLSRNHEALDGHDADLPFPDRREPITGRAIVRSRPAIVGCRRRGDTHGPGNHADGIGRRALRGVSGAAGAPSGARPGRAARGVQHQPAHPLGRRRLCGGRVHRPGARCLLAAGGRELSALHRRRPRQGAGAVGRARHRPVRPRPRRHGRRPAAGGRTAPARSA